MRKPPSAATETLVPVVAAEGFDAAEAAAALATLAAAEAAAPAAGPAAPLKPKAALAGTSPSIPGESKQCGLRWSRGREGRV
eukprot:CAMPEP_0206545942 /NCGR_PEP_ID=MMETSP0325_2-20121206/12421_1 /ASSEMBLY_ACC=CAM_ASM_000347 /TAXON_ID=2866 /ORGANISM="Crypthecodinium cohnii, Strain Seligo" /LENGTH=81 /DNA_ID=CAMNT_0054044993 /DNA_START=275 /DNA_END=520 /DNA_ORIENTATION=+